PAFMAPETTESKGVDLRCDIYSLGAVLYFMLTGTVVFPHLTITETVMAHVGRAPEPPSKRGHQVPLDLEKVILRCLEKRPDNRYESALALEAALGRCAAANAWAPADAFAF